jgi:hypothetical protein
MPTEKEPPAMPTNRPMVRKCQNSVANSDQPDRPTVDSISTKKTMRPPNLSVQHAQRQADQRTGEHRRGDQDAELGLVEAQLSP